MSEIRYTKDHEYVRLDGESPLSASPITRKQQLGDVVFVELPAIGKKR